MHSNWKPQVSTLPLHAMSAENRHPASQTMATLPAMATASIGRKHLITSHFIELRVRRPVRQSARRDLVTAIPCSSSPRRGTITARAPRRAARGAPKEFVVQKRWKWDESKHGRRRSPPAPPPKAGKPDSTPDWPWFRNPAGTACSHWASLRRNRMRSGWRRTARPGHRSASSPSCR